MEKKTLRFRMMAIAAMIGLLFGVTGKAYSYDFSAVCETGQTIYYNIIDAANLYVEVTYPGSFSWDGYTKPIGNLILPESVEYNNKNYIVTSIGRRSFIFCNDLISINLPHGLLNIGEQAFYECSSLVSLNIPNTVSSIGEAVGYGCVGIEQITVEEGNPVYDSRDNSNAIIHTNNNEIIQGCKNTIIPFSVTTVGNSAFRSCSSLLSINIPESIISIGDYAFSTCTGLSTLIIPNSVCTIGYRSFYHCSNLVSVSLSNSLTSIGWGAFYECPYLTTVTIPNSVLELERESFFNCENLESVIIGSSVNRFWYNVFASCPNLTNAVFLSTTPPNISYQDVFYNSDNNLIISVPYGKVDVYKNASNLGWSNYGNKIQAIPNNYRFITEGNWSILENWLSAYPWQHPSANSFVCIEENAELNENVTIANLSISAGKTLTIKSGAILTVTENIILPSNNAIIIEDGAQLVHNINNAEALIKKAILPYTDNQSDGWNLIALPLLRNMPVASVVNMLNEVYDLYYYDEVAHHWRNQKNIVNNFKELQTNQGYLYANNRLVDLEFEGTLLNGASTIIVPLSYTETAGNLAGFNLVGNPFVHNVTSYGSINVADGCFRMNENKDNLIVCEINEDNPLRPAEGFFVKATGEGASITFNARSKDEAEKTGFINIELNKDEKLIDRLIVKFDGEPLEKFSLKENCTKLFAMKDHQEMAVVVCEGNEQHINFMTVKSGTFTLSINSNKMNIDYLHLIDNLTGNDIDLLVQPAYTFEAKTSDYASRFRLVFTANEAGGDACVPGFAFINGSGNLSISEVDGEATLQVMDVLGHVLSSETFSGSYEKKLNVAPGNYMLRLINGDNVRTQKIVVK